MESNGVSDWQVSAVAGYLSGAINNSHFDQALQTVERYGGDQAGISIAKNISSFKFTIAALITGALTRGLARLGLRCAAGPDAASTLARQHRFDGGRIRCPGLELCGAGRGNRTTYRAGQGEWSHRLRGTAELPERGAGGRRLAAARRRRWPRRC